MSTELVKQDPRIGAIKLQLEKGKALIAQVAPKHLTADRMVRLAMLAVSKQPKLAECSGMSILKSMMVASELGLEPGGALGHGYLVPYNTNQAKRGTASPDERRDFSNTLQNTGMSSVASEIQGPKLPANMSTLFPGSVPSGFNCIPDRPL